MQALRDSSTVAATRGVRPMFPMCVPTDVGSAHHPANLFAGSGASKAGYMKLRWKSYGDHGVIATGDRGTWRIYTDGMWWYADLDDRTVKRFSDRQEAKAYTYSCEDLLQ